MNRSKLTPCRKVGLSRKKNTPLKSVETLLKGIENVAEEQSTPKLIKKTKAQKSVSNNEINNDTPCRSVGLSRKRKSSTPFSSSQKESNKCTTPNVTEQQISKNSGLLLNESSDRKKNGNKPPKVVKSNDDNPSCAKKLSNLFSSSSGENKHNKVLNEADTGQVKINLIRSISDVETNASSALVCQKEELRNVENTSPSDSEDFTPPDACNEIEIVATVEEKVNNTIYNEVPNVENQNPSQFIKVCYSNKERIEKTQKHKITENVTNENEKPIKRKVKKKSNIFYEMSEDDDDFETGPINKKPKKFERSKTDFDEKRKKSSKNKLKKSLSVGDSKLRTLTESSITSNLSSIDSISDCFVKLEKIKEFPEKPIFLTPQEQSDDDFDSSPFTTKGSVNLDSLEQEVEEKRQILEELKRSKMYKKMHGAEDLKQLTSRWKNACVDALQDLLKQLNMHSYISMENLLRKLNIPEDFVPLSQ